MFQQLNGASRLLIEANLRPVQGDRFQPTGFPDIGAAVYERPDGRRMLLVESAQSMANRLERTCLSGDGPDIAPELQGLPYVVSDLSGATTARTSSLIEAHRINSPYIISDPGFQRAFSDRAAYATGNLIDWKAVAGALFYYDPNSLVHGAFLANLKMGQIKVPRLLTSFVEAEDVREAASGGVKNNPLDPTGKIRAEAERGEVYSNVPYQRTEYTARKITAYFNLDLSLLRGYGLDAEAMELLLVLSLYKIRRLLEGQLRFRTACDLTVDGAVRVVAPEGFVLPDGQTLLAALQEGIRSCEAKELFASPAVTQVRCPTRISGRARTEDSTEDDGQKDEVEPEH
jgi:CRISPR-associated protein Csb1